MRATRRTDRTTNNARQGAPRATAQDPTLALVRAQRRVQFPSIPQPAQQPVAAAVYGKAATPLHVDGLSPAEKEFYDLLVGSLPPVIAREDVHELLGGAISRQSMAKCDCEGKGPDGAFTMGRKVLYRTDKFVLWMIRRYGVKFRSPQL